MVGNKIDLVEQRKVYTREGMSFAKRHGSAFFETSALDATGVHTAFECVLKVETNMCIPAAQVSQHGNLRSSSSLVRRSGTPIPTVSEDTNSDEDLTKYEKEHNFSISLFSSVSPSNKNAGASVPV